MGTNAQSKAVDYFGEDSETRDRPVASWIQWVKVFFKSGSTCAILWVLGNMQLLNERLTSLAITREKMKEKRLMTDIGIMSSGEYLLGNGEISFLTSLDVTGLNVLIAGPLWRQGSEGANQPGRG